MLKFKLSNVNKTGTVLVLTETLSTPLQVFNNADFFFFGGGALSTMDSILASHPAAPDSILGFCISKKFSLGVAKDLLMGLPRGKLTESLIWSIEPIQY